MVILLMMKMKWFTTYENKNIVIMMKKIICSLIVITLFTRCIDINDEMDCCVIIDAAAFFKVSNAEGLDMLDPTNPEGIDTSLIKLFYKNQDNEMIEVYKPRLDASRGYDVFISELEGVYKLNVYLNTEAIKDNISYTYIEWPDHSRDEIKAEFSLSKNNTIVKKIWVNSKLEWDQSNRDVRLISLVK